MYRVEFRIGTTDDYKLKITDFEKHFIQCCFQNIGTSLSVTMVDKKPLFISGIDGYRNLLYGDIEMIGHIAEEFMLLFDKDDIIDADLVIKNLSSDNGLQIKMTNEKQVKEMVIFGLKQKAEFLGL